jgi:hypothetical protein
VVGLWGVVGGLGVGVVVCVLVVLWWVVVVVVVVVVSEHFHFPTEFLLRN